MFVKLATCARRIHLRALARWLLAVERDLKWPNKQAKAAIERERERRRARPFSNIEMRFREAQSE